ncbi:hypothetical protein LCGC14_0559900 [marine sediment metagenome]|uniref:Uncharacterized protein n=1 Tax=marine sediment metagenome TaxID=412755 RepID=A0A0F9UVF3_9ZZZZ
MAKNKVEEFKSADRIIKQLYENFYTINDLKRIIRAAQKALRNQTGKNEYKSWKRIGR